MSDQRYRLVVIVLLVLIHLAALLQFDLATDSLAIPPQWRLQVFFLVGLSLAVSVVIPFARRHGAVWVLLAVEATALVIAGMPMGPAMTVESCLLVALVLTASTFTARWPGTVFSAGVLALELLLQTPMDIAGTRLAAPSGPALLSFGLSGAFVIAICHLASLFREQNRRSERVRVMLDESTLQLAQTNMELQEHAVLSQQRAAESERRRLAREVHDVLAYTLTSLIMMMEAAIDLDTASWRRFAVAEARRIMAAFAIPPDQLKDIIVYGFKRSFYYHPYPQKRKWVRKIIDYYEALEKRFGVA